MKTIVLTAVVFGLIFASPIVSQAQPAVGASPVPVEIGNKFCPVSGRQVGQMGPAFKYTYKGKVYNFCCPLCQGSFDQDPQKYSKIAQEQGKQ